MPLVLLPFVPAVCAGLAVLALRLLARVWPGAAVLAPAAGLLAGAVALLPFNLRAFWAPRVVADHLLLVAVFGVPACLLQARVRRRWVVPLALAMATGWWVAKAPPALPEFWRAGFVVTVGVLLLVRPGPAALCAASLAGMAGLLAAGAAPVWQRAALIPAAAYAASLPGREAQALPGAAFLSAVLALAVLAGGHAVSGRFGLVEAAAAAPVLVAWAWPLAWPLVARRLPALPFRRPPPKARVAVRRRRA